MSNQGGTIRFMVSCESDRYAAAVVRLLHGDSNPAGPGFKSTAVASTLAGDHEGVVQHLRVGSYVRVPAFPALGLTGSFTIQLFLRATTPAKERQALVSTASSGHGDGVGRRCSTRDGSRSSWPAARWRRSRSPW